MHSRARVVSMRSAVGAAVCALLVSAAIAKDHNVSVATHVSTQGLDLSRAADVQTFYTRLQNAAWMVCTRGTRADLLPVDNLNSCYEKALGDAVRSAKTPLLTQLYLTTHTPREAALHGIEAPAALAATQVHPR